MPHFMCFIYVSTSSTLPSTILGHLLTVNNMAERLQQALQTAGVDASIGYALRHRSTDLEQTLIQADQQMYVHKRCKQ